MKNKNSKIIAFVMVFALLIAMVIVTSVANAKTTDIVITSDKETISAGETAIISVKVTTNYPVATMSIPVFYDKTLVDVSDAATTLTEYAVANTTTESQSVDAEKIYANTDIDSSKFGFVLATYIGGANTEVAESIDEVVLTFKVTAKSSVSGNAVVKVVEESAKTSENVAGMLYFGAVAKGTTITDIPENVESKDLETAIANVKIGELSNLPTLDKVEEYEYADYVVVDTVNTNYDEYTGIIYGIDVLDQNPDFAPIAENGLMDALTTTAGDDYMVITPNAQGVESTGSLVEVFDANGELKATYIFVYFGDVDGDGLVTSTDGLISEVYEGTYEGLENYAQFVACDVDGDGLATSSDGLIMEVYEGTYEGMDYQYNLGQVATNNAYDWIY